MITGDRGFCNGLFHFPKCHIAPRQSTHGFTLLEVMIAFAITAIAVAALYAGMLTGLRATTDAGREIQAIAIARSRLAAADPVNEPTPGVVEGEEKGGFRWRMTTTVRMVAAAGPLAVARPLVLYDVRVTVFWPGASGRGRSLTLETRRAGPPAGAPR